MPLRAIGHNGSIHAFEFDQTQWKALKGTYRNLGLRMPCCDSQAIPKSSSRGNHFFAHARKGECSSAPESLEHLYFKQLVAQAALKAGWKVETERRGQTPDGEDWIADIFCQKGEAKIAFEIQVSPQTHEETLRRQARYRASGVRGAWFFSSKIRQGQLAHVQETPAFVLTPFVEGEAPSILGFEVGLLEFVIGMLTKQLVWHIPTYNKPIYVEYMKDQCWACKAQVKQVYGYLTEPENEEGDWHGRAFTPASMSTALEEILPVVTNKELLSEGLNFIGKMDVIQGKKTHWPYCNHCIHCHAPQNNFHVGKKLEKIFYREGKDNELGNASFERKEQGDGFWKFISNNTGQ